MPAPCLDRSQLVTVDLSLRVVLFISVESVTYLSLAPCSNYPTAGGCSLRFRQGGIPLPLQSAQGGPKGPRR